MCLEEIYQCIHENFKHCTINSLLSNSQISKLTIYLNIIFTVCLQLNIYYFQYIIEFKQAE